MLAKYAQFPWEVPFYAAETRAYGWVHGRGIGPEFLGHLTEAGSVTGFLMEYIDGARTAGPGDLAACQRSLAKLHSLGIRHGDINKHKFLAQDGEAVLVDFETAERTGDGGSWRRSIGGWKRRLRTLLRGAGWGFPWLASSVLADEVEARSEGQ